MDEDLINFLASDFYLNFPTFPTAFMYNFGIIVPFNQLRTPNIRDSAFLHTHDLSLIPWFWTDLKVERTNAEKTLCLVVIGGTIIMTLYFIIKNL